MRLWIILATMLIVAFLASEVMAKKSNRNAESTKRGDNKKYAGGNHHSKDHSTEYNKKGKRTKEYMESKERKSRSTEGATIDSSSGEILQNTDNSRREKESHVRGKKQKLDKKHNYEKSEEIVEENAAVKSKRNEYNGGEKKVSGTHTTSKSQKDNKYRNSEQILENSHDDTESIALDQEASDSKVNSGGVHKKDNFIKKSKSSLGDKNIDDRVAQEPNQKSEKHSKKDKYVKKSEKSIKNENIQVSRGDTAKEELPEKTEKVKGQKKNKKSKSVQDEKMYESEETSSRQGKTSESYEKLNKGKKAKHSNISMEKNSESFSEDGSMEEETSGSMISKKQKKYKGIKAVEDESAGNEGHQETKARQKRNVDEEVNEENVETESCFMTSSNLEEGSIEVDSSSESCAAR